MKNSQLKLRYKCRTMRKNKTFVLSHILLRVQNTEYFRFQVTHVCLFFFYPQIGENIWLFWQPIWISLYCLWRITASGHKACRRWLKELQ